MYIHIMRNYKFPHRHDETMLPEVFRSFGFNAHICASQSSVPWIKARHPCLQLCFFSSNLFRHSLKCCLEARARLKRSQQKLAALCKAMKQQYAWLLNHISADPIKQRRTKLSPKSRHKEDSWAIESTGLHPHLLHHIPQGPNTDMVSVGSIADVAATWQNSSTLILRGRVIINCSSRPQQLQECMWISTDSTAL